MKLICQGEYLSDAGVFKRRRSNVAVIIVRIVFIRSFLFYCLFFNHSFQTNPNRMTNCFKLILFYYNLQLHCSCVAILICQGQNIGIETLDQLSVGLRIRACCNGADPAMKYFGIISALDSATNTCSITFDDGDVQHKT